MREYGQVQSAFWQSADAQAFTDAGKLLAVYLLTGPHTNGIGCFRLPDGYVMADLGWSQETVLKGFEELDRNGFANRYDGVVFVPNFLRWNQIANGNIATARFRDFDLLPKGEAKVLAARSMLEFGSHWSDAQRSALETVSRTVTQTVCQPEKTPRERKQPEKEASAAPAKNPPAPASDSPTVVSIPLNTGEDFPITAAQVREFSGLYPAVDVTQALRGMRAWCVSNPAKRKTRSGVMRFVNAWLAKEQDRGKPHGDSAFEAVQASPAAMRRLA